MSSLSATIPALLAERALAAPDAPMLSGTCGMPIVAAELWSRCGAFALAAAEARLRPGQRVLVAMGAGPEPALAALAAACFGEAALVEAALPRAEAAAVVDRLRPAAIVAAAGAWSDLARESGRPMLSVPPDGDGPVPERQPDDVAAVLGTSGSTGAPRAVLHTHRSLLAAARNGVVALGVDAGDRVLDLRPGQHASSLVGALLLSLASGGVTIRPEAVDPVAFFEWLERLQPTWYTAAPAVHAAILAEARRRGPRRTSLRFIRSSAAALPPALAMELERLLGAPVLDGYGMTEVPLIASARRCDRVRPAETIGRPAGVEIAIRDGEVVVRGAAVMAGYADDPDANGAAFVEGWFRTGDLGTLDREGQLRLTGRTHERINRGGEKVDPAEVEACLKAHPAVVDAGVFAELHPRLGEELAAAVVRRSEGATAAALRRFAAERLAASKVPRRICFVERLPRDAQGKLLRERLASAPRSILRKPKTRPIAPDERGLAGIWAEALGLDNVGTTDDFFELGGDSLAAAAILTRVERELGARLPPAVFFEAPTVEALMAAIGGVPLTTEGPAVVLRESPGRTPFFCVHGIGGTAFRLAALAARLGADRPFVALQAPGLDGRQAPLTSVEALAELYLQAVAERQQRGPYLLGGFCMGGAVAYEMARRLEARGARVALLALIDPPPLPLGFRRGRRDRVRVAASAALRRLGLNEPGPPIGEDESAVMQANRRALRRYRPASYGGAVRMYCASEGPAGAVEDAEASIRHLARSVELVRLPGGHMDLVLEPGVARVAAELQRALENAGAGA